MNNYATIINGTEITCLFQGNIKFETNIYKKYYILTQLSYSEKVLNFCA